MFKVMDFDVRLGAVVMDKGLAGKYTVYYNNAFIYIYMSFYLPLTWYHLRFCDL